MNICFSASKRDILRSLNEKRKIEVDAAIDNSDLEPEYGRTCIIVHRFQKVRPTLRHPERTHRITGRVFLLGGNVKDFSGYSTGKNIYIVAI